MARSRYKTPFLSRELLLKKLNKSSISFVTRSSLILPLFIGKKLFIYNGRNYKSVNVVIEMVGLRVGEFSFTRRTVSHLKSQKR